MCICACSSTWICIITCMLIFSYVDIWIYGCVHVKVYLCVSIYGFIYKIVFKYMYVCLFGKLSLRRATSGETLLEAPSVTDTTPIQLSNHTTTKPQKRQATMNQRTKQNKTKQNKTKQNKTKQNKTKQNKTKQNKTKQIKTKQNKQHKHTNTQTHKHTHTHHAYPRHWKPHHAHISTDMRKLQCFRHALNEEQYDRTRGLLCWKDVFIDQERKLGDEGRSDTVVVLAGSNDAEGSSET